MILPVMPASSEHSLESDDPVHYCFLFKINKSLLGLSVFDFSFWCAVEGRDPSRRPGGGRESLAALRCRLCWDSHPDVLRCRCRRYSGSSLIFSSSRLWSCSKAGFYVM